MQWDDSSESWEKEIAPSFWYNSSSSWNQAHQDQDWNWQAQTTSTWQDESLLNGSVDTGEAESILKEVLLEENSVSNNIGLQIEEDDVEERPDDDASGGSSEDI